MEETMNNEIEVTTEEISEEMDFPQDQEIVVEEPSGSNKGFVVKVALGVAAAAATAVVVIKKRKKKKAEKEMEEDFDEEWIEDEPEEDENASKENVVKFQKDDSKKPKK